MAGLVVSTSDRSSMERLKAAYTATAVAVKAMRIWFIRKVITLPTHCMAMLGRPTT